MPSSAKATRPAGKLSEKNAKLPSSADSNDDKDATFALRNSASHSTTPSELKATPPSTAKRLSQNRVAQRAFRLRHAARVRSLELKSHVLAVCQAELIQCRRRIAFLETLVRKHHLVSGNKQREASEVGAMRNATADVEPNRRDANCLPYDRQTGDLLGQIQSYATANREEGPQLVGSLSRSASPAFRAYSTDPFMSPVLGEYSIASRTSIGDNPDGNDCPASAKESQGDDGPLLDDSLMKTLWHHSINHLSCHDANSHH